MISRFRARFEFTWRAAPAATSLLAAGGPGRSRCRPRRRSRTGASLGARAGSSGAQNRRRRLRRNARGRTRSPAITGWAMLGLESAGRNPLDVRRGRATPVDYLRSDGRRAALHRRPRAHDPGAGRRRREPAAVRRPRPGRRAPRRRSSNGSFEGQVNLTAFGVLALRAAGAPRFRSLALGRLAARGENARRRLGLSTAGRERPRQHRRGVAGAGGSRQERGHPSRGRLPATGPARQRGLRAGRDRAHELAVDRLGGPGPGRRRRRSGQRSKPRPQPAELPGQRSRPATATTATPPSATRPRCGSPSQALLAVNRKAFPLAAVPRTGGGPARDPKVSRSPGMGPGDAPGTRAGRSGARGRGRRNRQGA